MMGACWLVAEVVDWAFASCGKCRCDCFCLVCHCFYLFLVWCLKSLSSCYCLLAVKGIFRVGRLSFYGFGSDGHFFQPLVALSSGLVHHATPSPPSP